MIVADPFKTQRDVGNAVAAELRAAGFDNAEEIRRGGFGIGYRCTESALDPTVAVKVLTGELDEDRQRFLREQRAMGRLGDHANIVAVLQVGNQERLPLPGHGLVAGIAQFAYRMTILLGFPLLSLIFVWFCGHRDRYRDQSRLDDRQSRRLNLLSMSTPSTPHGRMSRRKLPQALWLSISRQKLSIFCGSRPALQADTEP